MAIIDSPGASADPAASATLKPEVFLPAEQAQDRLWNLMVLVIITMVVVTAVAAWTYTRMQASLHEIRASGLASLVESNARAMRIWIEEKKRDAERRVLTPEIQREAVRLAALAGPEGKFSRACSEQRQKAFLAAVAPIAAIEDAAAFRLVTHDGHSLAARLRANCGRSLAGTELMKLVQPVFGGRTVFVRPLGEEDAGGEAGAKAAARVLVWVASPVRTPEGEVIAALALGRRAEEGFGTLLSTGLTESTRDSFAFDLKGHLLTQSRFRQQFVESGALAEGRSEILALELREPPSANGASPRPLTTLVRRAIEQRAAGSESEVGVVLEPYRNHRGAEVIGAWRWFPEKEFAVAVEIEASEAYAPLQYLENAFDVLLGFLGMAIAGAGSVSFWAIRMRAREARRVGQYRIEREIGEGGLSHVYLARHTHLKRPVAVKILKAHLATDEVVTRFQREVQLCSQLTHPNTIEIYDYGRTKDGSFFYAMEYVQGISLQDLVKKEGAMPAARVVHAMRQACGSLGEAHARGLVHRDVKPANLMLCTRGGLYDVLKILDFGLVKQARDPHTRDITQFARVLGTPLYMAPERLRNAADADERSDIYALGAVMHFMLTGRELFESGSDHELFHQVMEVAAPPVTERGAKDVPPAVEALILKCLAKDRADRPATIEEVDAVLVEVARERPWRQSDARAWWNAHEMGAR